MINYRKRLCWLVAAALAATASTNVAHAQTSAPPPSAPTPKVQPLEGQPAPAAAPNGQTPAAPVPDEVPPGEAGSDDASTRSNLQPQPGAHAAAGAESAVPLVFPSGGGMAKVQRVKPLRITVGLDPTAPDFGGEADQISIANEGNANIKPKRWTFAMHGFLVAPLRVGIGPSNVVATRINADPKSYELHAPAIHVLGIDNLNDWNSVDLNPAPYGSLNVSAGNALITGTMIIAGQAFYDVSYKKLSDMGTISQAYLTLKFSDLFGARGGLAVTAGAFSNRYGMAGPKGQSSGYYNTYLFGRTHVAGANVTADIDLTEQMELVIEGGLGAKAEVIPWANPAIARAPYLPDQGPTPQGSNFVWQLHPALFIDEWLKVAAHYMTSYTPNDVTLTDAPASSHMTVLGAEVHVDRPRMGNAYLGYSHVNGEAVLSLSDGIELLNSTNGYALTQNYFNPGYKRLVPGDVGYDPQGVPPGSVGDSGKIDTVLFQYLVRLSPLLELPATGTDLSVAIFGMFNHVTSDQFVSGSQDKIKFGSEAQYSFSRYMTAGVRFDRVMPDGGNSDVAYSALSPRLVFRTNWHSREYILLSYARYFLGSSYEVPFKDSPSSTVTNVYDKNLLVLSAQIAF